MDIVEKVRYFRYLRTSHSRYLHFTRTRLILPHTLIKSFSSFEHYKRNLVWQWWLIISGLLHVPQPGDNLRQPRQVEDNDTEDAMEDTFQIVLLGDEVSFDCAVESADVTEV